MDESINASLKYNINPQISAIGSKIRKKKVTEQNNDINHTEAANLIDKKSHTLIIPKSITETIEKTETTNSTKIKDKSKTTEAKKKNTKVNANVRFETVHGGRCGNIFASYQEGKTTVIEWNIDHPFYERFVISNRENKTLITSVDFLIYSLAVAQNQALGDDENKAILIESMLSIMSANMRALLS